MLDEEEKDARMGRGKDDVERCGEMKDKERRGAENEKYTGRAIER